MLFGQIHVFTPSTTVACSCTTGAIYIFRFLFTVISLNLNHGEQFHVNAKLTSLWVNGCQWVIELCFYPTTIEDS